MDDRIRPFSCGSQFSDWQMSNCERCKKYSERIEDPPLCEIDYDLGMAYLGDGTVSPDIAKRMGYTDNQGKYNWQCGEVEWTESWKEEYRALHQEAK